MDYLFTELRDRLPMPDVARFYGLEVNRAGFANCPFHPDNEPSLKIYDDHYHCFGCGAHGDVTDFVARLFGVSQYEAAKKLDYDFGLHLTDQPFHAQIKRVVNPEVEYHNWLHSAERILNDYLNAMCRWQRYYAPKRPDEPLHPLFGESLKNMEYYQYIYEQIRFGSETEKREWYENGREIIERLQERMKQHDMTGLSVKRKAI